MNDIEIDKQVKFINNWRASRRRQIVLEHRKRMDIYYRRYPEARKIAIEYKRKMRQNGMYFSTRRCRRCEQVLLIIERSNDNLHRTSRCKFCLETILLEVYENNHHHHHQQQ